jgi:monoamine oxidase
MTLHADKNSNRFDVTIVGAGVCGLGAAIQIAEQTAKKVAVLEGANVPGGRARSGKLINGLPYDKGAHWLHGGNQNPFFQWLKQRYDLGVLVDDTVSSRRVTRDRKSIDADYEAALDLMTKTYEDFKSENPHTDTSMANIAEMAGTSNARAVADFMASGWMAIDDARLISARGFFDDPLGPGGMQLRNGMGSVTDKMAEEAAERGVEIIYGTVVDAVFQDNEKTIVHANSGQRYTAANTLITVSAGVLQKQSIAFDDCVTAEVMKAVSGINMGHMFKALVPLKEQFFRQNETPVDLPLYILDRDKKLFIHAHSAGTNTLTGFAGGSLGRELQRADTATVGRFIQDAVARTGLFKDFESAVAGDPVWSNWSDDPLTEGTYPIDAPGRILCGPVSCGRISFAGDAFVESVSQSPGQMAGAWNSGVQSVRRILSCQP